MGKPKEEGKQGQKQMERDQTKSSNLHIKGLLAQAVDAQERKCIGHRFRWRGKKKDLEALAREEEDSEPKEGETDKEEGEKEGRIDEGERNLAFRYVSKNGY